MLPNALVRAYLLALAELLGKNGLNTILNVSGLSPWIENYPPDDELHAVSFESFSRIHSVLEDLYGVRTGQNLSKRAAKASFLDTGNELLALDMDSANADGRLKVSLQAFVDLFSNENTEVARWEGSDEHITIVFEHCPNCVSSASQAPMCFACTGWIEAFFELIGTEEHLAVTETSCLAAGESTCSFEIRAVQE